jgi:hypothetical protein
MVALPALAEYDLDGGGAGTAMGSDALLIHPKNVVIGIQRQISIEPDRNPRARTIAYVVSVRADVELQDADGVVKVSGIEHA